MISIIAAIGQNGELGKENKLLWHIPGELARFKRITMGHPIIMGRKTFASIGRVLPGRTNIIVSRNKEYTVEGAIVCQTLEEALHTTRYNVPATENEVFIIGGGQIFAQAMPFVQRLYLTVVHASFDADTFFPDYSMFTKVVEKEEKSTGEYKYTFLTLEK